MVWFLGFSCHFCASRRSTDSPWFLQTRNGSINGSILRISYLEPREISLEARRARLKDQFGFDCSCALCESSNSSSSSTNTESSRNDAAAAATAALEGFVGQARRGKGKQNAPRNGSEPAPAPVSGEKSSEPAGPIARSGGHGDGSSGAAARGGQGGNGEGRAEVGPPLDNGGGGEDGDTYDDEEEEDRGGVYSSCTGAWYYIKEVVFGGKQELRGVDGSTETERCRGEEHLGTLFDFRRGGYVEVLAGSAWGSVDAKRRTSGFFAKNRSFFFFFFAGTGGKG